LRGARLRLYFLPREAFAFGKVTKIRAAFLVVLFIFSFCPRVRVACAGVKLVPAEGIYHSAHPDFGPRDDAPSEQSVRSFEDLAGKKIVWAFVACHWDRGINFPTEQCNVLNAAGVIPLVGIMPWSVLKQNAAEPLYTLERIARGDFDAELVRFADDAKALGFPIMIEFGPEVNGSWFPWNGAWNGRDGDAYGTRGFPDGPERYRDAYTRIADIFSFRGADDVTWVFHVSADGSPKEKWNSMSFYYPGDGYVDWIGVSVYGRLAGGAKTTSFEDIMRRVYPGLCALSESRPIAVLEMGVTEGPDKADWTREAFGAINGRSYPRLKAVSWWNKTTRYGGGPSALEIDSSASHLEAYREGAHALADEAVWFVDKN
jgi:beta-mannanase